MKVVLLHDVVKLGKVNSIVEVNDGYAKNFLFKKKLAVPYNETTNRQLQQRLDYINKTHDLKISEAISLKEKIEKIELNFFLQVNNQQKAFGSVDKKQILNELNKQNIKIDKISLPGKIKLDIGHYKLKLIIFENITAILKVNIMGKK